MKTTAKYFRPSLEILENRDLLAFVLTPGANVNVSQLPGTQSEGTIALDPTGSRSNLFSASVNFGSSTGEGLFAGFSSNHLDTASHGDGRTRRPRHRRRAGRFAARSEL